MRNNFYPNTTQSQIPETGYYRGVRPQSNPDDTFPLTEDDNIDYLTAKYPALAERIQLLRNRGVQDEQIQNVIETQALPRLNYFANGEQIRKMLGQTDQSMEKVARYENLMRYKLFKQAYPDKSDNDIQEAIQIQQMTGVPARAYLNDTKLFKAFTDKVMRDTGRIKERETYLDAAARGLSNFWTQFQISDIRTHQRAGDISDEEADRAVEQLRAKFIPEPLFHSFGTDAINGAFSIATQKYNTLFQSVMTGGYWGALGGAVGLVGGGIPGAWQGAKLGYWLGSMYEGANQIFTLSAGADYENMIKLKDENGQPIDRRAAWLASGITGFLNVATEYGLWKYTAKLFPGVESIFGRGDFIKAVQHNPVLREKLAQLAKDTTKGIIASTGNNTIESVISDYAVPLVQFIAEVDYQQPFPQAKFDWDKLFQNAKDTAGRSFRDFSAAALPSVFLGLAKISKQHFDYSRNLKNLAVQLNVPEAQLEESFYQARLRTQEELNQAQDNSQPDTDTQATPEIQEQPTATQTTPEPQQETVQDAPQEKKSDYVFMPLEPLQKAGYEPVFTVDNEGAVTWEQYEQIKADNPDFIQSVQYDLRFGATGVSISDMEKKIEQTDQAKADFFHSPENQARMDDAAQDFINAGADEQEAQDLGMLIGAVNASSLARTGEQLPPITVREVQELEQQIDYSRLSPEYDINNPDTWPDMERAEKFKELTNWDKLPDSEKNVKALLDLIRGKTPDKADELSEKSGEVFEGLKDEAPDKIRSTRNALFRDEFEAYSQTLRENAKDVGNAIISRTDLDPARYEINSTFPKGKRRNPDESYYFENWDGQTKIDFATDGADLKIRIKHTGDKSPVTIAVKNYRTTNLYDVVNDLTSGFTANGFQISESPTAMYLARSLYSLWTKLGLPQVQVNILDANNELMNPPTHFTGNDELDEGYYSPDTQENNAVIDDLPDDHIPDRRNDGKRYPGVAVHTVDLDIDAPNVHDANLDIDSPLVHTVDLDIDAPEVRSIPTDLKQNVNILNAPDELMNPPEQQSSETVQKNYNWNNFDSSKPETWPDVPEKQKALKIAEQLKRHKVTYSNPEDGSTVDDYTFEAQNELLELSQAVWYQYKNNTNIQDNSASTSDRTLMPEQARFNLASDEQKWRKTVDTVLADQNIKTTGRKQIPVMTTPLVMTLVGANHFPVSINDGKLKLILRDHQTMTPDILKDVPRAITDPIAIFESKSEGEHPAKVILTELKDTNGADIITAFHLDYKGDINKLASSYAKEKGKGGANPEWFREQAEQGRMLYINTDKAKAWAQSSGVDLTQYSDGVKTQKDLQQLWNLHKDKGWYYTDPDTGEIKGWMEQKYGRAIINLIKSGNFATKLHETAHVYFNFMTDLAKKGHVQMNEDFETILRHAEVTREAWDKDTRRAKGGAIEQANEWFAKAFELYVSEGKAPSKGLIGVFERARKRLLEIYDDITTQLGIKNYDDEVRAVFNRLLTLPGDESETVSDIVIHDIQTEEQIKLNNRRIGELEEQIRLQEESRQAYEQGEFELNPEAVETVENYGYEEDFREIQQDELKAQQDYVRGIYQFIKNNGGINAQDVIYLMGKEKAADISKAWIGIYRKKGTPLDIMAERLVSAGFEDFRVRGEAVGDEDGGTANMLLQWLDNYDYSILQQNIPDVDAHIAINTDILNAFLAARGVEGTIDYLKKRLELIQNNSELADETAEIKDWLSRLDPSLDDGIKPPRAKKKRITKQDVRKAATTGFKMGQEQERLIQKAKQDIHDEITTARFEDRIEALDARIDKLKAQKKEIRDKLKADTQERIDKLKAKQADRLETQKDKYQERLEQAAQREIERIDKLIQKLQKLKQERQADKAKYQERIQTIQQRLTDKFNAKIQKLNESRQREIAKRKQARDELHSFKLKASETKNIDRLVKSLTRMRKGYHIRVEQLQEIQNILDAYSLKHDNSRSEKIRSIIDTKNLLTEDKAAEIMETDNITTQDIDDFLSKIHLDDMTLGELRELHDKVSSIFQQGRRKYQIWEQQRKESRLELQAGMEQDILSNTKAPEKRVITGREDLHKQRNPLANLLHNYWIGTQQAGTYLAGLGDNFRRVFGDGFNQRRGEAFRFIHQRKTDMLLRLKELGLTFYSFAENAITLDGKTYSWAEVIGIANAMRNPKSAMAVLWGNFVNNLVDSNKPYNTEQEGMNAINQILDLINAPENEKYKKAAQLILQDFDTHYDRIESARRRDFNRSMNKEENYSPMYRLRRNSAQGLVDTQLEALGDNGQFSQLLHKVADNFTISRKNINPMNQAPISLNAWANWLNAMTDQEFAAALGGYAADVTSALLLRGEHGTIKNMIQERRGDQDWETLRSIFNDSINDSMMQEQLAADEIASALVRNRSIVYVAGRIPTALSQFASYFTAIPYASTKHLFRSLVNAINFRSQFLENVYDKAPELRYTGGDPVDKAINRNAWLNQHQIKNDRVRRGINAYKRGIDALYKGVQLIDNWTKSIVFDAVYNSELENGNSEQDAIRLAYRAVQDTQPASSPREMTRLNRNAKGVTRLAFTQFMGALAPLYNMSVVDVARNLAHPSWNTVKASAWDLLAVGISIAAAGVIKDFFSGKLPTYRENPDGSIDDISSWFIDTEINALISSIPVFNRIWDGVKAVINHKHYSPDDRFTEPFTSIAKGLDYYFNPGYEGEYNDKAVEQIVKGLGLMGIPIPFAGIRDFFRFFGAQEEE